VATFQSERRFVRVLAAYGGVFLAGSLALGVLVEGFRPITEPGMGYRFEPASPPDTDWKPPS
jgi:small multidrug resistance family-3 protein